MFKKNGKLKGSKFLFAYSTEIFSPRATMRYLGFHGPTPCCMAFSVKFVYK